MKKSLIIFILFSNAAYSQQFNINPATAPGCWRAGIVCDCVTRVCENGKTMLPETKFRFVEFKYVRASGDTSQYAIVDGVSYEISADNTFFVDRRFAWKADKVGFERQ